MERRQVESSIIESVGYDHLTAVLEIQFTHGDLYQYFMVPQSTYQGLMQAPSKGRFFAGSIRDRFQFRRL